ncbi:MAG: hypothetical protein RIQ54_488 [Candidatus Parcubacteria bacterium]|jgi:putative oxidoreductase
MNVPYFLSFIDRMNSRVGYDSAILLIRIALAVVFIAHGYSKISNLAGTVAFFGNLGMPAVVAYLVAFGEFFGGISLLLGVGTLFFAPVLSIIMVGALYFVKSKFGTIGAFEFEFSLLMMSLAVAVSGPGSYSFALLLRTTFIRR